MNKITLVLANSQRDGARWLFENTNPADKDKFAIISQPHQLRGYSGDTVGEVLDCIHRGQTEEAAHILECVNGPRFKGVPHNHG